MQKVEECYGELDTQRASGVLESGRWKRLEELYVCAMLGETYLGRRGDQYCF